MNSIIVLYSYHHKNTEKVANAMAKVLGAQVKTPQEVRPEELREYDLVGFGSGVYGEKHHRYLLELADKLPEVAGKKAFIFSTNGVPAWASGPKGYISPSPGHNTNSFLKYFGGINKGRPNAEDIGRAEEFARGLI